MKRFRLPVLLALAAGFALAGGPIVAAPETRGEKGKEPYLGMPGRDVGWVPTPPDLVEIMLDMAKVKPDDVVMDLGSGDGRNVIAAARRGALAVGFEYNEQLVALSNQTAEKEGVADRARFVQGDMYLADISKATVLALFLLPENMSKMTGMFMGLRPGSRIVVNNFQIPGWPPDETAHAGANCQVWCTAHLWIVPAHVGGTWRLDGGELTLKQIFQMFTGTLVRDGKAVPVTGGRLRGTEVVFSAGGVEYVGRVDGGAMTGAVAGGGSGPWSASRTAYQAPIGLD